MADVKPIKITADVSQAEAEFQRLKAAYGEVTEAEEKFLRKVAESETQLKAKKQAADGLGVSMGSLSSALNASKKELDGHNDGIEINKRSMRDMNDIVETASGLHIAHAGALFQTLETLGPLGIAVAALGFAIEEVNRQEEEINKTIKEGQDKFIDYADAVAKAASSHADLNEQQRESLRIAARLKSDGLAPQIDKQREAVDRLHGTMERLSHSEEYWNRQVLTGATDRATANQMIERDRRTLAQVTDEYKRQTHVLADLQYQQVTGHSLTEKETAALREQGAARKDHIASLTGEAKVQAEYDERRRKADEQFGVHHDRKIYAERLKALDEWRAHEIQKLRAHGAGKAKLAEQTEKQIQNAYLGAEKFLAASRARVEKGQRDSEARRERAHQQFLDRMFKRERAEIDKTTEYKDKAAKVDVAITREAARAKMEAESAVASAAAGFINSTFGKNKAASAASALINLFQGISKIWATWGDMPVVAGVLTGIESAIVGQSINTIKSTNLGQADGGMGEVTQGGTYQLMAGEMVLDPSAANTMREVTSAMKKASVPRGGGVTVHFNGTVVGGRQAGREITKMVRSAVRSANLRVA